MQRHLKLLNKISEQFEDWTRALIAEAASNLEDEIICWAPKPK
jgi:hypothetical protein